MDFKTWLSLQEKTLYHGTIVDNEPTIRKYGLRGGWHSPIGSFVSKFYNDDEYGEPTEDDKVIFMADKQDLGKSVNAIVHHVAAKLGKDFHDVTDNDIRNHGLLVIIKDGDSDATRYDYATAISSPRGAEDGDYYAPSASADVLLKGAALLRFLRNNGVYPRDFGPTDSRSEKVMRGKLGSMAIGRGIDKEKALSVARNAPLDRVKDQLRTWRRTK